MTRRVPGLVPRQIVASLHRQKHFAWLDANAQRAGAGRFSWWGCDPDAVVMASCEADDPLAKLRLISEQPGFWLGYIGYDAAHPCGHHCRHSRTKPPVPSLWFARYPAVVRWDHHTSEAWICGDSAHAENALRERLYHREPLPMSAKVGPLVVDDEHSHASAIETALEHIRAGNIYQVNLARRWRARYQGDALALFLRMRAASPVPFGFFLRGSDVDVISRSMEQFLAWEGPGEGLATRPIKGTIARGKDALTDLSLRLRNDAKERAEHTMIIDLMRNDLSRVALPNSVRVDAPYTVEPYAGLCHLVSTVRCRTQASATLEHILRATFPPGSITGTPKHRAMEIIAELEPAQRFIYTGAVGMVTPQGRARLAVAIRTAIHQHGWITYWAGGGIVADSHVQREVAETSLKAQCFVQALHTLAQPPVLSAS